MMVSDLIRIAAAGGGLQLDCENYMTYDLIRIVAAGSQKQSMILLENCKKLSAYDAIKIAEAGNGYVIFKDLK